MKFSELKQMLQEKFGIDHLADIARELGVSPQAVSNWKARDRVPYKYVLKLRKKLSEPVEQVNDNSKNNTPDPEKVFPQYGHPQNFEEDSIDLTDMLLILARQLKIIIITPTILCTLTIINVLFFAEPVFESTAKIMSSFGGRQSQAAGLAAQFGINLPTGLSEPEWVYSDIIKSRTLARAMLKRKFNTNEFGPQKSLLQILTSGERISGIDTLEILAVDRFLGMIKLSEDRQSRIFTIIISASEPTLSSELNAALIQELDKHQRRHNQAITSETRQFIEERIFETRKELETAEETLKDFNASNRRIENSPALQLDRQRLVREVSVLTSVFTTLKQQLETTKIEEVRESDYVIILDPPEIPLYRSEPKKRQMVIMAGLLGLGLGTGLGFLREVGIRKNKAREKEKMSQAKSVIIKHVTDFLPRRFKKK